MCGEMIEEELKRVEKIVVLNNKILRSVKGILKMSGKQVGDNSVNIKKIFEGLQRTQKEFQNFGDEFKGKEPTEEIKKEISRYYT